jgi:hypothetical protein
VRGDLRRHPPRPYERAFRLGFKIEVLSYVLKDISFRQVSVCLAFQSRKVSMRGVRS